MSIVGAIVGNSSLVTSDADATCSCKLAIMRGKQKDILPEVLLAFIKTKYGQNQIQKFKRGAAQTGLLLEDFDQLFVPVFSSGFQEHIRKVVQSAHDKVTNGTDKYKKAEGVLLSALGYRPALMSKSGITEKSFSETFGTSGRLDAEYYQPKYDDLFELIHVRQTVSSMCEIHDNNFTPHANDKYRYIELANVGAYGEISTLGTFCGSDLPSRARRCVKAGQVIVSSIEGSLQSCALITDDLNGALCSTGFFVLDSRKINPETLLVLFKSDAMQMLMKQRCSGTILASISKGEFLSMPLPEINFETQVEIAQKVQESFALRRQADRLIDIAVKAVEIAVERDEAAASAYIKENR